MARFRIEWVDAAKGIAIYLVALAHAVQWTTITELAHDWWNDINLLLAPVRPSNGLWFLYALALFFVIMKLLDGRVDWRVQLALTAVQSAWFFARADTGNIAWNGIGRYFVFFMLGCFFRDRIMRLVERRGLPSGLILGLSFVGLAAGLITLDGRVPFITSALVFVSLLAVASGLVVARYLTRLSGASWVSTVGRNTLPIYVLHVLFVSGITSLLLLARGQPWLSLVGHVLPVLVAAAAVAGSLGFWRLTRNVPVLRYGYKVPRWFSG
jgi:uncharacterized membrane protein YcfT